MRWLPGLVQLRAYRRDWLRFDLAAGIVLAAVLVPQGIAYAELAGLPPVTGLYTTIVCLAAYALIGPSRVLVLGPDSSVSPLIFAAIVPLALGDPSQAIALAGMLALLVGLLEVGLGLGKLGFIADLLSKEVQAGYMNGLALIIIVGQLPKLSGFSTDANGFLQEVQAFVANLSQTNAVALILGAGTLVVLLGLPRLTKKVPAVLIAVGGALLVTAVFDLSAYGVRTIGVLPSGFPRPSLPWTDAEDLLTLTAAAIGIVLVSLTDTIATSASFATRRGDEVDANQEMIAVGLSSVAAGLFQGFAVSVSGSRTAVAGQAGARSQVSGLVGAVMVLGLLVAAPGLFRDLPQPALAAVVIAAAVSLMNVGVLLRYWRLRKSSLILSLFTTAAVLLLGVLDGILVAVALALILFFRRNWWPPGEVLAYDRELDGWHAVRRYPDAREAPGVVVFRWEAPLFFANSGIFRQQIRRLVATRRPDWIVLQCEAITDIDVTAADMLKELIDTELAVKGVHVVFVDLRSRLQDLMVAYGLCADAADARFYTSVKQAMDATRRWRKESAVYLPAPISALTQGISRGSTPLTRIREHGDLAIGTFDLLDGEMMMLDGRIYRLAADGAAQEVEAGASTPFAVATFFEPITEERLTRELEYQDFIDWILDQLPSPNLLYAFRVDGRFAEVTLTARSPQERDGQQAEPEQPVLFRNVDGTVAGFYTPTFLGSLNTPGFALCFLSADRQRGGRVRACRPASVTAGIQFITAVQLGLPLTLGYLTTPLEQEAEMRRHHEQA